MISRPDLRPGPFCATPDTLEVSYLLGDGDARCYVECQECRARDPSQTAPEAAVDAWNSRFGQGIDH